MICYKCKKRIDENPIEGLHEQCFTDWFKLHQIEPFTDIAAQRTGNISAPLVQLSSSFFHGKFRKYSAVLGGKSYILKVQQPEYPELPITEYLCNELALFLSLDVPDFFLIRFQNLRDTFVSQNFMATRPSSNLIHLYRFFDQTEQFDCATIISIIEKQTRKAADVDKFIEICLFDALIGNHDRHGRNLAFIQNPKGLELAPFYDNPTYLAIEEEWFLEAQHEPRGKIFTSGSTEPKMYDYCLELIRLGYRENIERFAKKVNLESMRLLIAGSFISEKRKKAIGKLIESRFQELTHAL